MNGMQLQPQANIGLFNPISGAMFQDNRSGILQPNQPIMEIVLDGSGRENSNEFFAGEVVHGFVRIKLTSPIEVRSLDVQLQGTGSVQWTEQATLPSPTNTGSSGQAVSVPVAAQEVYLNELQNILGTYAGETLSMSKGSHTFHFRFRLPASIPASFSGSYGTIRYDLRAKLVSNLGILMDDSGLFVRQLLNNSYYARFLQPAEAHLKRTFAGKGIKAFSAGSIEAKFQVNRMGFSCNENIIIHGKIQNKSPVSIREINASLVQKATYSAAGGNRRTSETRVLAFVSDKTPFKGTSKLPRIWRNVRLQVPSDAAPSYLEGSSLMEVFYELVLELRNSYNKTMVLTVPVVVGLTPIAPVGGAAATNGNYLNSGFMMGTEEGVYALVQQTGGVSGPMMSGVPAGVGFGMGMGSPSLGATVDGSSNVGINMPGQGNVGVQPQLFVSEQHSPLPAELEAEVNGNGGAVGGVGVSGYEAPYSSVQTLRPGSSTGASAGLEGGLGFQGPSLHVGVAQ